MVGRISLAALAASALLLVGGQSAFAADAGGVPYVKLVQVYVPDQDAVDSVVTNYDDAEYKKVEDDGTIQLNVFVTDEEEAALKDAGYRIGGTIEDSKTGPQRMAARQETDRLLLAIVKLPERCRELMRLKLIEQKSYAEIRGITGIDGNIYEMTRRCFRTLLRSVGGPSL